MSTTIDSNGRGQCSKSKILFTSESNHANLDQAPPRVPKNSEGGMPLEFHIPASLMAKIVSFLGAGGPDVLKNMILSGPEGKAAVFSKETLSTVRLDRNRLFVGMSKPNSPYFTFFSKCLEVGNQYALYLKCLRLAFCEQNLPGAIEISSKIKDAFPLSSLLHIMLRYCSGKEDLETLKKFKRDHRRYKEVAHLGETLKTHINCLEPRRSDTYMSTWKVKIYPECWEYHMMYQDYTGRCIQCIYYYLSREICLLS